MAFSIQAHLLPSIRNYNEALCTYNNAIPRNRYDNAMRYLASRSDVTKLVWKDDATQDINFRYHDTDVVIWHADNTVTIDVDYNSVSTRTFASRLSGHDVYSNKGYTMVCGKAIGGRATIKDGIVISGAIPTTKLVVNRKRAKEVMQPWQPVLLHAKAIYTMDNNVFTDSANWRYGTFLRTEPPELADINDFVLENSVRIDTYDTFAQRLRNKVYTVENGAYIEKVVVAA